MRKTTSLDSVPTSRTNVAIRSVNPIQPEADLTDDTCISWMEMRLMAGGRARSNCHGIILKNDCIDSESIP